MGPGRSATTLRPEAISIIEAPLSGHAVLETHAPDRIAIEHRTVRERQLKMMESVRMTSSQESEAGGLVLRSGPI
jgi:hypothetical protein